MHFLRSQKLKYHSTGLALLATLHLAFPQSAHAHSPNCLPVVPNEVVEELVSATVTSHLPAIPERPARRVLMVPITAYTSTVAETDSDPFTTASGSQTRDGIIAANFLPFGAQVRIPGAFGDKIFVVEDRMHPRNSHKVDIWMETRDQAFQWGVRRMEIEVL